MTNTDQGRDTQGRRAGVQIVPTTSFGRWSVVAVGVFFVAVVVVLVATSGPDPGWIAVPVVAELTGAIGALVTGVIALVRRGERGFAVIFAVAVGALVSVVAFADLIVFE
jgi:hypothetical protein